MKMQLINTIVTTNKLRYQYIKTIVLIESKTEVCVDVNSILESTFIKFCFCEYEYCNRLGKYLITDDYNLKYIQLFQNIAVKESALKWVLIPKKIFRKIKHRFLIQQIQFNLNYNSK